MTNGFILNRAKSLQIYFCVKRLVLNDFLKDVERREDMFVSTSIYYWNYLSVVFKPYYKRTRCTG